MVPGQGKIAQDKVVRNGHGCRHPWSKVYLAVSRLPSDELGWDCFTVSLVSDSILSVLSQKALISNMPYASSMATTTIMIVRIRTGTKVKRFIPGRLMRIGRWFRPGQRATRGNPRRRWARCYLARGKPRSGRPVHWAVGGAGILLCLILRLSRTRHRAGRWRKLGDRRARGALVLAFHCGQMWPQKMGVVGVCEIFVLAFCRIVFLGSASNRIEGGRKVQARK